MIPWPCFLVPTKSNEPPSATSLVTHWAVSSRSLTVWARSIMWMPLRAVKMYCFIFGFQRLVWCPKWAPASRSCFSVTAGISGIISGLSAAAAVSPGEAYRRGLLERGHSSAAARARLLERGYGDLVGHNGHGAHQGESQKGGIACHRQDAETEDGQKDHENELVADPDSPPHLRGRLELALLAVGKAQHGQLSFASGLVSRVQWRKVSWGRRWSRVVLRARGRLRARAPRLGHALFARGATGP